MQPCPLCMYHGPIQDPAASLLPTCTASGAPQAGEDSSRVLTSRWSMVVLPDSSGSSCGTMLLALGGPTLLVSQVLTLTCQQRLLLKILEPPAAPGRLMF